MGNRLDQGFISIEQVQIFANERNDERLHRRLLTFHHVAPFGKVNVVAFQSQVLHDVLVHALLMQQLWDLIDRLGIVHGDHRTFFDIGEQSNFAPRTTWKRLFRAAHQDVRLQADGAEFFHGVLCGLRLYLSRLAQKRHVGEMDEHGVAASDVKTHLPRRLQERERFYVPDGSADFHNEHVEAIRTQADTTLDLVRYVGDDLNGPTQIVSAALSSDDFGIDATRGEIVVLGHAGIGKTLVVTQVQICLGAVGGDEDLTMLNRAHGAWIHVDVGVHLQEIDLETAGFKLCCERGGH